MTKQETAKILTLLRELYPQGKEITEQTVNAWHAILADYDYKLMWGITKEIAGEWDGYTMPPPATLVKKYKSLTEPSAIEYWNVAEKAIRKGRGFTKEDFEKLPPPVQKYFGGVSAIRDLGLMDIENLPYEKARFLKQIKIISDREEYKALGDKVKQLVERL